MNTSAYSITSITASNDTCPSLVGERVSLTSFAVSTTGSACFYPTSAALSSLVTFLDVPACLPESKEEPDQPVPGLDAAGAAARADTKITLSNEFATVTFNPISVNLVSF